MIFFGRRASVIGRMAIGNTKCQYCETSSIQHVTVYGEYVHVYWIPLFPIGREVVAECTHCKRTIGQIDFPSSLQDKYFSAQDRIKKPYSHWTGLAILASLLGAFMFLFAVVESTREVDQRENLFKMDVQNMTSNPSQSTDSISFKIKAFLTDFMPEELNTSEFEYLTNEKDDKILILVNIPKIRRVKKSERGYFVDSIEMAAELFESIEGKKKYIGVFGGLNIKLIKTPTTEQNRTKANKKLLFEFYEQEPLLNHETKLKNDLDK